MTSILLINDNKIVSRLLQLSSEKNGYTLKEVTDISEADGSYDVVFIDSENYSDALMGDITTNIKYSKLGYIGNKQETSPEGFDLIIEKPFLPTDFVDMIKEQVVNTTPLVDTEAIELDELDLDTETELLLSEDTLDLDNLDDEMEELLLDEELEEDLSLDDLSAELSTEDDTKEIEEVPDDFDLSLNSAAVMTTGIAASMATSESAPEELADMVSELDNMGSELELADEPSELSLELEEDTLEEVASLDDELELEEVSTLEKDEVALEEEVPSLEEETLEESLDEVNSLVEEDIVSLDVSDEKEPSLELEDDIALEETSDDSTLTDIAAGVGMAAVGAVAATAMGKESIKEESVNLDDFNSLNESEMQSALGEEVVGEIISEEIVTDGEIKEEGLVEMDDMQAWIKDAVQKAITPQMIQEALNGMDININLTFNTKESNTPS